MSPCTHGTFVSKAWVDDLSNAIQELRAWLANPAHIDETLEELADMLVEKHHDYGEENLATFGELGILVRSSDKVARLKNLLEKDAAVKGESRADSWRDLAGYALQALIMMKRTPKPAADLFEIRRNRLIRGICPDCGEGVLLRRQSWDRLEAALFCSDHCGFSASVDLFDLEMGTTEAIHRLAGREAVNQQKWEA